MKRLSIYVALLLLGSSFLSFSWAMEDNKWFSLSKILSKFHPKKSNKKESKGRSLRKKKSSKKSIRTARIDAYLAKGRRAPFLEK